MKKYQIIYADPPWSYKVWSEDKKSAQGCAKRYYQTMSIEDICNLPVNKIADENCKLFLWATPPCLKEALQVITAWGFEYKTIVFAWVKTNKRFNPDQITFLPEESIDRFYGIGHWTASNIELCLGALVPGGRLNRQAKNISQIVTANRREHSRKPDEVREKIVRLCGDIPRIELFARQKTEGWDAIGNGVDDCDIKESLAKLIVSNV
ncbi:MAG: adenine methyltransferase [Candidatus Omnitrophica bacterium]|nr:adenine methyltransferase [Candidatus Omnitrophota bacterium]